MQSVCCSFFWHASEILFFLCAGEGAEKILCENLKTSVQYIDTENALFNVL